jgi:hypothetical protein
MAFISGLDGLGRYGLLKIARHEVKYNPEPVAYFGSYWPVPLVGEWSVAPARRLFRPGDAGKSPVLLAFPAFYLLLTFLQSQIIRNPALWSFLD